MPVVPVLLPGPPCATAVTEEANRSRWEKRSLRWVAGDAEKLCCAAARSVVEITREVRILRGKDKGKQSSETVLYVSSLAMDPAKAPLLLQNIRIYWDIESGLHQRLDVTAREDASRVRNRNALLVLGIARRGVMGVFRSWRSQQRNQRQSTLQDFYDTMKRFHCRQAWQKLRARQK